MDKATIESLFQDLVKSRLYGEAQPQDYFAWAERMLTTNQELENTTILAAMQFERDPEKDEIERYFLKSVQELGLPTDRLNTKLYVEETLKPALVKFIQGISQPEINFIAAADYGQNIEEHEEALEKLIFEQAGIYNSNQYWYPYEVVELCRWGERDGHSCEFAICNAIVALNILSKSDLSHTPDYMLEKLSEKYNKLSPDICELITTSLYIGKHYD